MWYIDGRFSVILTCRLSVCCINNPKPAPDEYNGGPQWIYYTQSIDDSLQISWLNTYAARHGHTLQIWTVSDRIVI